MDLSNIVYTSMIDVNNIENPSKKLTGKYMYPLYYIPLKGNTIKYKINKSVYLLNIGDIQNIKTIYNIIDTSPLVKNEEDRAFLKQIYILLVVILLEQKNMNIFMILKNVLRLLIVILYKDQIKFF